MINLQKLRYLSSICAYCNKVLSMSERTNDHIIPRSAGGKTETKEFSNLMKNQYETIRNLINKILEYPSGEQM